MIGVNRHDAVVCGDGAVLARFPPASVHGRLTDNTASSGPGHSEELVGDPDSKVFGRP